MFGNYATKLRHVMGVCSMAW